MPEFNDDKFIHLWTKICDVGLTVGHEKLGDEVNIPVPSSAHWLRRSVWKVEALVQLWKKDRKQKNELLPGPEESRSAQFTQNKDHIDKYSSRCTILVIKYIDWFYRSCKPFTSSRGVMEELSPP